MAYTYERETAKRYLLPSLLLAIILVLIFPLTASGEDAGTALAFDGVNDYVALGDTNMLFSGDTWTGEKSMSAWVRLDGAAPSTTPASGPLLVGNDGPRTFGISRANYSGLDRVWVWNWDASGLDVVGVEYTPGEWFQVALVHDGFTLSAYRNGVLAGSVPSGPTQMPNANADGNLFLGGTGGGRAPRSLAGALDEVRLWDVALDEATVSAWAFQEVSAGHPNWADLRAYYQMSNGAGTTLTDDSGHGNEGTLRGGMGNSSWITSGAFGETGTPSTPTSEPPTATATAEPPTPTPTPTGPTATATATSEPPTATPTATAEPPTATPTPTNTPLPPGDAGYALAFDGTTDYVQVAETAYVLGSGWETTKTVSLWVKPTGVATCTNASPAHCDAILGDRPRWWGMSRGVVSGADRIWVWNFDGNMDVVGVDYTVGEWVHIAMAHANGVLRVYRNGVEAGSTPSGATMQPNTGALPILHLGGIIINSTRNWSFEGELDEVRFWNYARSAEQINQDMLHALAGTEAGLTAYYAISDGAGSILSDDSTNDWFGTLVDGGQVPGNGLLPQWVPSGAFGN
ncbi:MAG: LamG domain-containing protein [Anaerolineae bacterium]|nr:LamG domain-containing protein [Anaerolineae bacterium]